MRMKFLIGLLFMVGILFQSCDKDEIIFPEYPQEKLEFNQVKYFELSGAGNAGDIVDSLVFSVPPQRVLKLENVGIWSSSSENQVFLLLNGVSIKNWNRQPLSVNESSPSVSESFPFWLPEGTHTLSLLFTSGSGSSTVKASVSAIEYNIVD